MTETLPSPESRKESYLAKAAGIDVNIPEKPMSRTEQYLNAIAEGGGGGGTSDFNDLTNRPKYNGTAMTGETEIPKVVDSAFTGTDGVEAGTAGLVPAPATTDAGKYLKADGTWSTVAAGPTVVQTTGTSETDVMSQKAVTDTIFRENNKSRIQIGFNADATAGTYFNGIAIGALSSATAQSTIAIGPTQASAQYKNSIAIGDIARAVGAYGCAFGNTAKAGESSVALGAGTDARTKGTVALGYGAKPMSIGEVNVGSIDTTYGYNNSNYRLLTGLYDGQSAHDAATYGQVNTRLGGLTLLTISQTDYDNLGTKDPNTLYVITGA